MPTTPTSTMQFPSTVRREDLVELAGDGAHRISILMPAHRAGQEIRQDPIRYRRLVDQAEERLVEMGINRGRARDRLAEPRRLLDDRDFWRHQGEGLALFNDDSGSWCYCLPMALEELVVAGSLYQLAPLAAAAGGDGLFYLVAVSQDEVHLLQCTRDSFVEVQLPALAEGRMTIQRYIEEQKQLQFHTAGTRGPMNTHDAAFHGHGAGERNEKARLFEYFRVIDGVLDDVIRLAETPVVFAGVDYLFPIFREAMRCGTVIDEHISGNFDEVRSDLQALHRQAVEVMTPRLDAGRHKAHEGYREGIDAGAGRALDDLEPILVAAHEGRVQRLLIDPSVHRWGSFDTLAGKATVNEGRGEGDEDLINLAAVHTLRHGGAIDRVNAEEMPAKEAVGAILRYA